MAKLSALDTSANLKLLLVGESGVGKTCFASEIPGKTYIIDFDGKVSSLAKYLEHHNPTKISEIDFESFTPNKENQFRVYRKFEQHLSNIEIAIAQEKFPFQTLFIDSITTMVDAMMIETIADSPGLKRPAPGVAALQDYLVLNTRFIPLIQRLLALPLNVIMTAHVKVEKDEASGELVRSALLHGQLPQKLPIYFEEVYRAYTVKKDGKVFHVADTQQSPGFFGRSQIPGLPATIPLSYKFLADYMAKKKAAAQPQST